MTKYPTKSQILATPRPDYPKGLFQAISNWKKEFYFKWNEKFEENHWLALDILAITICVQYKRMLISVSQGKIDHYDPNKYHITLSKPSILTMLHELAHHLFGPDETQACRWSVWLYQLRFRNDYNKLVWQEHMLVKPSSSTKIEKSKYKEVKMLSTK